MAIYSMAIAHSEQILALLHEVLDRYISILVYLVLLLRAEAASIAHRVLGHHVLLLSSLSILSQQLAPLLWAGFEILLRLRFAVFALLASSTVLFVRRLGQERILVLLLGRIKTTDSLLMQFLLAQQFRLAAHSIEDVKVFDFHVDVYLLRFVAVGRSRLAAVGIGSSGNCSGRYHFLVGSRLLFGGGEERLVFGELQVLLAEVVGRRELLLSFRLLLGSQKRRGTAFHLL